MKNAWPMVPLGEVLRKVDDWIPVIADQTYREVTVRLWGKGVTLRREVLGAEIKSDRRLRVKSGQFIASRIDARNGAFGLIPDELDGAVVTNDFPVFEPDKSKLHVPFLGWMSKTATFVDLCKAASEGTTNRVRLKEDQFLRTAIALPPLAEQRRIVARIKELAAKIADARELQSESVAERDFLQRNAGRHVFETQHWPKVPLESVCSAITDCLHSNPICSEGGEFPTVRSPDVGWGTIDLKSAYRTDEAEYIRRTRRSELEPGDLVLVREGGGTGKAGLVESGQRFSLGQRVMMLRSNRGMVEPRFLLHQWLSPLVYQEQILDRMKGSASPHLNIKAMRKFQFVLPPLPAQRQIIAHLDTLSAKAESLTLLQLQSAAELDAMLPSILDRAFRGDV